MVFSNIVDQFIRQIDLFLHKKEHNGNISSKTRWKRTVQKILRHLRRTKLLNIWKLQFLAWKLFSQIDMIDVYRSPLSIEDKPSPGYKVKLPRPMPDARDLDRLQEFGIHHKEIRLGRLIGSGGFGSVYFGSVKGFCIAVKKMHPCNKNKRALTESYIAEGNVLNLTNENIVRTVATLDCGDGQPFVVMEYAGDFNLQQLINDPSQVIEPERRLRFSTGLANALRYAHNNFIVHLDVKPSNIIISPTDNVKLGDFGCCQRIEKNAGYVSPTQRSYLTGTFAYRAPELLRGEAPTTKADLYSFGITLWQMATREQPYSGENQHVVIFGVVANHLRPRVPASILEDEDNTFDICYTELYKQCWETDPRDRPSSADVHDILDAWDEFFMT